MNALQNAVVPGPQPQTGSLAVGSPHSIQQRGDRRLGGRIQRDAAATMTERHDIGRRTVACRYRRRGHCHTGIRRRPEGHDTCLAVGTASRAA